MQINNIEDFKFIKISNLQYRKKIFKELNILPINEYYSEIINKDISVYVRTKKLEDFLKENNMEVYDE